MIYFNGDSFVAGVELGDDELPEYPGTLPWPWGSPQHEKAKAWIAKTYDIKHPWYLVRMETVKDTIKKEYDRAFPSLIGKKLNVPIINHALGGASMDRIVRTTIADLIRLKKEHKTVIAIIGTTHMSRSEVPNSDFSASVDLHGSPKNWTCISLSYRLPYHNSKIDPLLDYKLEYEKNYHMLVNFYKNVILLQDFCRANDIKLMWISTYNNIINDFNLESVYRVNDDLTDFIEYSKFEYTLDMAIVAQEIKVGVLCPSGHFSEKVHQRVADDLCGVLGEHNERL